MASYLEEYGETQARHSRKLRWFILTPLFLVIAGILLYFQFRDYGEYRRAKQFLEHLQSNDYKGAYAFWGCTDANPCSRYPFEEFMKDWGPQSSLGDPNQAKIADHMGCEGGVITTVRVAGGREDIQLWVDRRSREIGFAPWKLKEIPPGIRPQLAAWMWNVTRNCNPRIGP